MYTYWLLTSAWMDSNRHNPLQSSSCLLWTKITYKRHRCIHCSNPNRNKREKRKRNQSVVPTVLELPEFIWGVTVTIGQGESRSTSTWPSWISSCTDLGIWSLAEHLWSHPRNLMPSPKSLVVYPKCIAEDSRWSPSQALSFLHQCQLEESSPSHPPTEWKSGMHNRMVRSRLRVMRNATSCGMCHCFLNWYAANSTGLKFEQSTQNTQILWYIVPSIYLLKYACIINLTNNLDDTIPWDTSQSEWYPQKESAIESQNEWLGLSHDIDSLSSINQIIKPVRTTFG